MTEDESDENQYKWEFFKDKPVEAFVHYYESIEEVPEKYQEEAQRRALSLTTDAAIDFLGTGEPIPMNISREMEDAIAIGTLKGLATQIENEGQEILNVLPESEGPPIDLPPGELGYKLFQMHVVTVSYAEAAGEILFRHHARIGRGWNPTALTQWASHEKRLGVSLTEHDTLAEQLPMVYKWATEKVSRLLLALLQAEVIEDSLYQQLDKVRERRNNFIHSAHTLAVNDFGDKRDVRDAVDECLSGISILGTQLEDVSRNPVYESFVD